MYMCRALSDSFRARARSFRFCGVSPTTILPIPRAAYALFAKNSANEAEPFLRKCHGRNRMYAA